MKVNLVFVPPGGGETDYSLLVEMPALPRPGDYISVVRPPVEGKRHGTADFIVRRTLWTCEYPDNELYGEPKDSVIGSTSGVAIECEFARGALSSEGHLRACELYENRGKPLKDFEATAY